LKENAHKARQTIAGEIGRALDRAVVLVGMMGAGKTSVGRRLAGALGWPFQDADWAIEEAAGTTIANIFTEIGEPAFRQSERQVIARLIDEQPRQVLALGGGSFVAEETRALDWRRSSDYGPAETHCFASCAAIRLFRQQFLACWVWMTGRFDADTTTARCSATLSGTASLTCCQIVLLNRSPSGLKIMMVFKSSAGIVATITSKARRMERQLLFKWQIDGTC